MQGNVADPKVDFSHLQDVLGQLTALKTYTHMVLAFATHGDVDDVSGALQCAAAQLLQHFPFLAGHVVRKGKGPGRSGLAHVVPYAPGERTSPVIVKNCIHLCSSMEAILDAGAPMDMLPSDVLAGRKGPPRTHDESLERAPVLEIQANFVEGGLLLVFQGHHNMMDMNGMGQIMRLFAKALRKESFSEWEIEQGNRDRRHLVRLLDPTTPPAYDMARFTPAAKPMQPAAAAPDSATAASDARWVYFHFSAESLAQLKQTTSDSAGGPADGTRPPWVTTDDVLSAFLALKLTQARLKRMPAAAASVATVCRAIDARRFLDPPIPREYLGHAVTCAYTELSLEDAAAGGDLRTLARRLRADVLATTSLQIQHFATKLHSLHDKGLLSFGARMDMAGFDLTISSWSGLGLCHVSFGEGLGTPALAKRPRLDPVEGLLYLMPKTVEGHVDVAVCAKEQDIAWLRSEAGFHHYGAYIG